MKIGDRCFVSGYIDEIRKDTVIVRNSGGYFGTSPCEVITVYNTAHPNWIPCSERLPEESGHKLCSFAKPNRIDKIYIDLAYWTGERWYGYGSDAIIAWMPLPEPWEVGSGKDEKND